MKTTRKWKSGNRLDSVMNVLLILFALGVLGVGALEVDASVTRVASADRQHV